MTEEKTKVWEELQTMAQNLESATIESKIVLFLAVLSKQNDDTDRFISEMESDFERRLSGIENSINDISFRLGALDSMVTKVNGDLKTVIDGKLKKKASKKAFSTKKNKKVVKKKKSKVFKHRK